jgi:hypothetical protein
MRPKHLRLPEKGENTPENADLANRAMGKVIQLALNFFEGQGCIYATCSNSSFVRQPGVRAMVIRELGS